MTARTNVAKNIHPIHQTANAKMLINARKRRLHGPSALNVLIV